MKSSRPSSGQIDSTRINSSESCLPIPQQHQGRADSDAADRTTSLKTKLLLHSKGPLRKKASSITPSSSSWHRKDFMQKIERFRFIDDSASSTTTVTSPVESVDRMNNGHGPCSHLITSAIEQFDDYVRSRYQNNDEINTYIERLNSDILTNGSYSDLNILNSSHDAVPTSHCTQSRFHPVNNHPVESVSCSTSRNSPLHSIESFDVFSSV